MKRMDALTLFGLFAVTSMLVTYALEDRSSWFILAFAGACCRGSHYGFLQGRLAFWAGRSGLGLDRGPALVFQSAPFLIIPRSPAIRSRGAAP
jgi:hypothetical protein